jgi:hypothetical protein
MEVCSSTQLHGVVILDLIGQKIHAIAQNIAV